jgi:hypothetical protein
VNLPRSGWAILPVKMGRSAHATVRPDRKNARMNERGLLHLIEDDLYETWLEDWAGGGVRELEDYLAKHLAFLSFLDEPAA